MELSDPLRNAMNISIHQSKFVEQAKQAEVTTKGEGEAIRTVEKDIRPVSILDAFPEHAEK